LSIEEQFYVVYPLLFLLLPHRRYLAVIALLVAAGPLIRYVYSAALAGTGSDGGWIAFAIYAASFAHFDAFLLGALIANFEDDIRKREWVAEVLAGIALFAAAAYVLCYVLVNRSMGATGIDLVRNLFSGILYGQGREVFVYTVVNLMAAAALVFAILRKPVMSALARPAISLVGRISYGGYLYHALVLWSVSTLVVVPATLPIAQRLAWFALVWSVTVAIAYASFRWFETPITNWSRERAPRSRQRLLLMEKRA
jgi:peptidoglycan/LPS O-acetylase OafA/YrhL